MKVSPSAIAGVEIHAPDPAEFESEHLRQALPYSVIVENRDPRTICFLGVRFDMLGPKGKRYSVVHYADTLRNPQQADFRPGTKRFVCAEPEYTALAVRGNAAPGARGRMNLDNLRRMLEMRASLDCVAFEDGEFAGPDSQGAFERLARERELEAALSAEVAALEGKDSGAFEKLLHKAAEDPVERGRLAISRKLLDALQAGGPADAVALAQSWPCRIPVWR